MPMYVLTHFIPSICELQQAKQGSSSKAGSEVVGHAPTKPAHAACLLYYYFVELCSKFLRLLSCHHNANSEATAS